MKKLNLQEFKAFIKQRVAVILEAEGATSVGEPTKVKMNSMLDDGGKLGKSANTNDPTSVKMNVKDGVKATGAQAEVKAGSSKGGNGVTAGQANANFKEKTTGPDKSTGAPFDQKGEAEMNSMDKEGEEGAKTYVETGSGSVGGQETTVGQKKPAFKEDAPKSDEKGKKIADAIQMKEGMTFKNKTELMNFIQEEAKRISKLI